MIGLVGQQLLAVLGMLLLLGLPGWALGRLLQVQLALPGVALLPAWFACGLGAWTIAAAVGLTFGWGMPVVLAVHGGVTLALLVAARMRERRTAHAKSSGAAPVSRWTIAGIALCVLLAAALRTRLAFDTLFHIGLVRRLAELPHPTFDNVDRITGAGVNPAYVLPTWQSALAGVSQLTGLDPATVVESMAGLVVLLAACAAGGFGRLLGGRPAAEVAAVAAYAWLRVWYPRREAEGDGIGFAVHPGNVALDVLLPLLLTATLVIVLRARGAVGRRPACVVAGLSTVLFVLLHANYSVYLGVIGAGLVLWLLLAGPWSRELRARVRDGIGAVALPGVAILLALLPALVLLDHFGAPVEQRIDYHLVGSGAWELVRPGHFYDAFGAAGLLAMLLVPFAVWTLRGVRRALLGGALLAFFAVGLVPPLFDLISSTGSLTVGLRIARPVGVLLLGVIAVALPALVELVRAAADARRSRIARWMTYAAPLAIVAAVAALYGYPLTRQEPPEYGWNWPTLVSAAALVLVLAAAAHAHWKARGRAAAGPETAEDDGAEIDPDPAPLAWRRRTLATATGLAVLLTTVALAPSGLVSLRRATWQSREFVAAVRADDLGCQSAIQARLRRLAPGAVLAADPVTGYTTQALAPVRLVADFKTWNGSTDTSRAQRRVEQLASVFAEDDPSAAARSVHALQARTGVRYLVVADSEVEAPIDSELPDFDAAGLRAALRDGQIPARRMAAGVGRLDADATDAERGECTLALWQLEVPEA